MRLGGATIVLQGADQESCGSKADVARLGEFLYVAVLHRPPFDQIVSQRKGVDNAEPVVEPASLLAEHN